jgi:Family of unknown function (DUF6178)
VPELTSHPAQRERASGAELLRLARRDRAAARARLASLSDEAQADACRSLAPGARSEFLMLVDHPERVVPLLPEAELVHTIRAAGMSEAAWLLELATTEQRLACFDLDCWGAGKLDLARTREWIDALIEAGRETLAQGLGELDLDLLLLALWDETQVVIVGKEDEPPDAAFTADGVVYFVVHGDASLHRVHEIAHATFSLAPDLYWRIAQGLIFELPAECEEYALRWRTRRLSDLGFPEPDDAMRVYRPLAPESVEDFGTQEFGASGLARVHELPRQLGGTLLGEALGEIAPSRFADVFGQVLAVANWLAIADDLPLSEPASIPEALRKAVAGIDRGLRELTSRRNQPAAEVLARTRPLDLFRVGATLDASLRRRGPSA